ncbi:efflux RND transporter periplasmic adaptor subunit [Nioella nitratireducens]|uniref:efflux RND transporter periplasmic adaptor subunit n=1 Tax=Nioella nitratireducens TaxID=1287720 RepID=UPI0008FD49D0|nr:HlyD family efflux transporter periplasmic adaptor subunit [Nioella nitratireducens]
MARKRSRLPLTIGASVIVAGALVAAFWPQPTMVDMGAVTRGPMMVTIDEEGRTRVHDAYIVSTPVAGRLLRVEVEPGDLVTRGETEVAVMEPTNPAALDISTRQQAQAAVSAAEAALQVARADLNAAQAQQDLAHSDLERTRTLAASGTVSTAALDRARQAARAADATVDTANAAIAMRQADLQLAQARLISFDDQGLWGAIGDSEHAIPLMAPANGSILQVMQQSETTLPVGTPIMEIGNIGSDLAVSAALLSTDAVQVSPGDPVIIDNWGQPQHLHGSVTRIDPYGTTRVSALGVEEQRVNVLIDFTSPAEDRAGLGHGFRVEVRIIVWQSDDALILPSAALFRQGGDWAVFVVVDGRTALTPVEIGHNNGTEAEVLSGLEAGATVVLYPSSAITDDMAVAPRTVN